MKIHEKSCFLVSLGWPKIAKNVKTNNALKMKLIKLLQSKCIYQYLEWFYVILCSLHMLNVGPCYHREIKRKKKIGES